MCFVLTLAIILLSCYKTVINLLILDVILHSTCFIPCSSEDFKKKAVSKHRHHMGYPPVTPNAVATDTILSQIFDQLWGEVG